MLKLLKGILKFQEDLTPQARAKFAHLALGQKPDALFIGCSDSRVDPRIFASTDPGDVFVHRNAGNFVPTFHNTSKKGDLGTAATIEFAIRNLNSLKHIIVCGHSECGAMKALLKGRRQKKRASSPLNRWLKNGQDALRKRRDDVKLDPALSPTSRLSQLNVLLQLEHLQTYPFIREQLDAGVLHLHGWWFDIKTANIYYYLPNEKCFHLLDKDLIEDLSKQLKTL